MHVSTACLCPFASYVLTFTSRCPHLLNHYSNSSFGLPISSATLMAHRSYHSSFLYFPTSLSPSISLTLFYKHSLYPPSVSDHFLSLFSSFHFHPLPRSVLLSISVPPVSTSVNVTLPLFIPPVDEIYWKS